MSRGVDVLVHSAAMKHVPAAEANPMECARTNIFGSYNVVQAARPGIAKVVALSTDKAASPANAYGASKLLLERFFCKLMKRVIVVSRWCDTRMFLAVKAR